jgi:predicted MPP superfamily phosphohydrolase
MRLNWRTLLKWAGLCGVAIGGALIGLLIAAPTTVDVGPFSSTFTVEPALKGDSEVVIPPLGSLHLDTHDGPAHLKVRLDGLDQSRTQALLDDPSTITRASRNAVQDVRIGVERLVMRALGAGMLGSMIIAAVIYRRMRQVAWAGGISLLVLGASFGVAGLTFNPGALKEPRYDGLLANAPTVIGDAQRIADRYDEYARQLEKMVVNVGTLYQTVSTLPVAPDDSTIKVLHVSDLHLNPAAWPVIRSVVEQFHIDVVADTGDINDWGSEVEANFVASIALLKVPYVFVRGNHDSSVTQAAIAAQPNAIVLDDKVQTIAGLTFAGIGDPRFTPDKAVNPHGTGGESQGTIDAVEQAGRRLAQTISSSPVKVDIALAHDPRSASEVAGTCPLVLAGHTHQRQVSILDKTATMMMVEGSTGGAGLRGLEGEHPLPLSMSVLYFDLQRELVAYDDITVGGTGLAEVSLKRNMVEEPRPAPEPSTTPS